MSTKIVIIDDTLRMREAILRSLKLIGDYNDFQTFASAQAYIDAGSPYDEETVIVSDYSMPDITGVELASRYPERAQRFIIITAGNVSEPLKEAEILGIDLTIFEKNKISYLIKSIKTAREKPAFK